LSAVGQRGPAAGWTADKTSEVIEVVETKPRKLVSPPVSVWVDVAPRASVASKVTEPLANAPLMSVPKKSPPIAETPGPKFEKVIEFPAELVDSQGLAAEPAPKKPSGALAVYVYPPALRLSGDAVVLVVDKPANVSTPGALTEARNPACVLKTESAAWDALAMASKSAAANG
jgi:hypothetical protein